MFVALSLVVAAPVLVAAPSSPADAQSAAVSNLGPITPRDVVYQIVTDRFWDGDATNNVPVGFDPSLFDGTGTDLKLYQGGDWQGIIDQLDYLDGMGVTALWISAPYANRDTVIEDHQSDGSIDRWTSFHGYHVRNFFDVNEHFGTLEEFHDLRDALHTRDMKLVIDFVANHTSRWQNPTLGFIPEDGLLYEPDRDGSGEYCFDAAGVPADCSGDGLTEYLVADPNNDVDAWFHGLGDRGGDDSRYGYRYRDLGSLADLNHANPQVIEHVERAAGFWKAQGIDGFRHDATLHMDPAFAKGLRDAIDSAPGGPVTHFGEFFIGRPDPKYAEYASFPDRTGIHNLDFEYFRSSTNTFGTFTESMSDFGAMLLQTSSDYQHEHHAVTFVDNHDVTRFRYIQPNDRPYHAALATLLTARGTPNIYYGTEQYVSSADASDIAGRVFLQTEAALDETTTAYQLIATLADLRKTNDGLAFGMTSILHTTDDVLVFEREFYDHRVVVAVNRQPDLGFSVPELTVGLPPGSYVDELGGLLDGGPIGVTSVAGESRIPSFMLSPGEVSVWASTPSSPSAPRIGTTIASTGRAGNEVLLVGSGLDGAVDVQFDGVSANVLANDEGSILATVPAGAPTGDVAITVTKGGVTSNTAAYEVLTGDQVQVVFHVDASTSFGENIHVVGNVAELGAWDPARATEAMLTPEYPVWFLPVSVPAGANLEFKFVRVDQLGNVTWESGSNRVLTAPPGPNGVALSPVYDWRS